MLSLTLAVLVAAAGAQASQAPLPQPDPEPETGSMAVMAFGHCDDPRLGQATRDLREELIRLKPLAVSSEEATARPGGGLRHSTLEEIRRTIDAGRAEFVNLNYRKAAAMLSAVLPEIDHLPPGADRWAVASRARVELAHVYFFDEKGADAVLAFFDVLRIQEDLKLDPLKFPPSLRRALDSVRASVRKAQRYTLRVTSREPNQPVFFNGREMGHTPFERALVNGSYEVVVGEPAAHGFARVVQLDSNQSVEADVAREARLRAGAGPCYETGDSREERLAAAALVAGVLSVDRIVAVRLDRRGEEEYVAAALVEVAHGREVREGRQRTDRTQLLGMNRLATFVLTGVGLAVDPPPPPMDTERRPEPAASSPTPWLRIGGIALGAVAVGLGVAALAENSRVDSNAHQLRALVGSSGALTPEAGARAIELSKQIDTAKNLRTGFVLGAAAAGLGSGTLVFLSFTPSRSGGAAQVSVGVAGSLP
jgi:hypothetical protein